MLRVLRGLTLSAYGESPDIEVHVAKYDNGRTAIQLMSQIPDEEEGVLEPYATLTVNIVDRALGPNEVFIKNWSENEGLLEWAQKNDIVGPVKRSVATGYVLAPVCDLHPSFLEAMKKAKVA